VLGGHVRVRFHRTLFSRENFAQQDFAQHALGLTINVYVAILEGKAQKLEVEVDGDDLWYFFQWPQ
jgi:hypothetical protein